MRSTSLMVVRVGLIACAFGVVAMAGEARADAAQAAACAAGLDANARTVYDATAPNVKPGVKVADALRSAVRPMVMGGKMERAAAKTAAEAAGPCLEKLTK